ncbi:hypothetical protein Bca52824_055255 [Brassica carinata]|uniref:Uncharacterized protein n=1 Tax=Brassica carinata TaxID=52824 RepID=A0A8X7RBE2_BRACI|nr:hypothetical protein Bca52824_055255 [Brassica carinata]
MFIAPSSSCWAKEIRDGGPKQLGTELVTVILSQGRDEHRITTKLKPQSSMSLRRRFCQLGKLVSRSSAEKQGLATTELRLDGEKKLSTLELNSVKSKS